ncbi:hypothetical protein EVAR_35578_1 [Eumeta japonica]|uniref:Uncharacterized protein n=1 Tax=Eumeta variegata TaxID=151549 RepID=A0A4C1XPP4_EUMVA|nr:hypothetical protein EVAR_35578_1 [Eumeta japonica]
MSSNERPGNKCGEMTHDEATRRLMRPRRPCVVKGMVQGSILTEGELDDELTSQLKPLALCLGKHNNLSDSNGPA